MELTLLIIAVPHPLLGFSGVIAVVELQVMFDATQR